MKKIILITIFITLSINAKIITISNENSGFSIQETIKLNIKRDNNIIIAKILKGTLRLSKNIPLKKTYIDNIKLCIGKNTKKGWTTEVCSPPYKLNRYITKNEIIRLYKHSFVIPIKYLNTDLSQKWFMISIQIYSNKQEAFCYGHNRKVKLNTF